MLGIIYSYFFHTGVYIITTIFMLIVGIHPLVAVVIITLAKEEAGQSGIKEMNQHRKEFGGWMAPETHHFHPKNCLLYPLWNLNSFCMMQHNATWHNFELHNIVVLTETMMFSWTLLSSFVINWTVLVGRVVRWSLVHCNTCAVLGVVIHVVICNQPVRPFIYEDVSNDTLMTSHDDATLHFCQ